MEQENSRQEERPEQPQEEAPVEEASPAEEAACAGEEASTAQEAGEAGAGEAQEPAQAALAEAQDKFLRLAAEYDNFRKRTAKEKESIWTDAAAATAAAFLSVYDNLERAMKQQTADEAYKKGVEMTMTGFRDVLARLGVEEIPALGERFDPNLHNAVMHVEDESVEESTVAEVFQAGFRLGEKVLRFAVVKVAN